MKKEEQNKIVERVKNILPAVVNFQETHNFTDFDYGFLYGAGIWEVTFFDENDEAALYFTADSEEDLVDMLDCETIARWHNEG